MGYQLLPFLCLAKGDKILLVGDSRDTPKLGDIEKIIFEPGSNNTHLIPQLCRYFHLHQTNHWISKKTKIV